MGMVCATAEQWEKALEEYEYHVDLREFTGRGELDQDWFSVNLATGNRQETIQFENRFRSRANVALEAWYEVVFWNGEPGTAQLHHRDMHRTD